MLRPRGRRRRRTIREPAVPDKALLVDPSSVDSIASGLRRAHADESLRADLRRRGLLHAATFSWRDCARKTLDVYEALLGTEAGSRGDGARSPGGALRRALSACPWR
jgi:hypothetical protein